MTYATYADVLRPKTRPLAWLYNLTLIAGGSLLVAISAQVAVHLPFSPVPITMQTLAVLLVAVLLGSIRGSVSMLLYLAEGAAGLPVFAGGMAGAAHILGPTGGYLLGFVLCSYLVGYLAEQGWDRKVSTTLMAMVLGTLMIYLPGLIWLAVYTNSENVLALGLYPFLPGAVIKIIAATSILPVGWKLIGRRGSQHESPGDGQ
ncbi:MAG: biotin transporter BioY [Fidelibacterota bacterium]|nr:MAG: biotin transporter BioY [Candidatus Neomarinimicrobiota bacterium]